MSNLENHESITSQGGGGYPPGGGAPPGGGWGPPGGGGPGGYGPPGGPPPGGGGPGGYGPPGGPPGGGGPGGYGPPGGGGPGGYGPPGGGGPGGYGPPGGGGPGGYGPPGGGGPGGYGPPGGGGPGGYGPPGGGGPGGYGPPGAGGPGGYGPPGAGGPPQYGAPPPYGGGGFAPPPYQPGAPPPGGGGPGFEATEAIGFGWNAVMQNFSSVGLPIATATVIAFIPYAILTGMRVVVIGMMSGSSGSDATAGSLIQLGIAVVAALVLVVSLGFMVGGITQFSLKVARGGRPEFGEVFKGGPTFIPMVGATFLAGLAANIGVLACIIGAFFIQGALCLYPSLIVDKKMGAIEALSTSWRMTQPYRVNALVFALLLYVVSLVGTAACCVGGILVSAPVMAVANVYVYLKLNGEQPRLPA